MGAALTFNSEGPAISIRPLTTAVNGPIKQQPLFHRWKRGSLLLVVIRYPSSCRSPLAVVGRQSSVVRYGMLRFTNTIGFTQRPFTRISQCRCGPLVSPVSPDLPTIVPISTQSPTFTSIALMWK